MYIVMFFVITALIQVVWAAAGVWLTHALKGSNIASGLQTTNIQKLIYSDIRTKFLNKAVKTAFERPKAARLTAKSTGAMLINNKAGKSVFKRPKADRFADKAAGPMMITNKAGNTVFEQSKAERLTEKAAGGISVQEIESAATAELSPGDLVFFIKIPKDDFTAGIISCSEGDSNVYHVAIVVKDDKSSHLTVMHTLPATGVERVTLVEAIRKLKPGMVELARMNVDEEWKNRAAEWAAEQEGLEYNDLFSPKHINSRGKKALYCSELVEEAFKNTFVADPKLEDIQNPNPFPPHKMTFSNRDGTPNSEWINYYRKLGCKEYPTPPKGQDGSNPSIMRMSPVVERVVKYEVNYKPH